MGNDVEIRKNDCFSKQYNLIVVMKGAPHIIDGSTIYKNTVMRHWQPQEAAMYWNDYVLAQGYKPVMLQLCGLSPRINC
jgi:hypothetical protein